jgi:hypothetical protein
MVGRAAYGGRALRRQHNWSLRRPQTSHPTRLRARLQPKTAAGLQTRGHVTLYVHYVAGRRVRRLAASEMAAGDYRFHWNSADDAGVLVRPGAYFVRVSTTSAHLNTMVIVLR